ncbi:MAG TPA: DUF1501 domain-containing protein [Kofleriaceae bacterium]|nr:DUF1501 domain-containing protein [Kofleriaceae bacterium]
MNRRRFLQAVAAVGGAAAAGCAGAARVRPPARPARPAAGPRPAGAAAPRHVVFIFLHGGYDSLLTFDPKLPREVDAVDLEYRAEELVDGRSRRYGPLFRPLLAHEDRLAILHGVRVDSAGHETAADYVGRGRIADDGPLIGDVMGRLLPGTAPIPHLIAGSSSPQLFLCGALCPDDSVNARATAAVLPGALARMMGRPAADWPDLMAVVAEERGAGAADVFASPERLRAYRELDRDAVALGELLAAGRAHEGLSDGDFGRGLNAAIEAIRLEKARFTTVPSEPFQLDTHLDNLRLQRRYLPPILDDLAGFLRLLASTSNRHGPLVDQTTVIIGTEMGRFNRLNAFQGRDHWPENSWLLAGRGIRAAPGGIAVGATDRARRSRPIDFASGAVDDRGRPVFVQSVFATAARAAGLELGPLGYREDDVLPCLLAAS